MPLFRTLHLKLLTSPSKRYISNLLILFFHYLKHLFYLQLNGLQIRAGNKLALRILEPNQRLIVGRLSPLLDQSMLKLKFGKELDGNS